MEKVMSLLDYQSVHNRISLIVQNVRFETARRNLIWSVPLQAMVTNNSSLDKVYIDRDPTHFRFILNFLRIGNLNAATLPRETRVLEEILAEAAYFELAGLETIICNRINNLK